MAPTLSKHAVLHPDDSDDDDETWFEMNIKSNLRIKLKDRGWSTDLFLDHLLDVVDPANSKSSSSSTKKKNDSTCDIEIGYDDIRNSCFSRELMGKKFKHMTDKKQPIHKYFWSWMYAISHLPYLSKYSDIYNLSPTQSADLKTRQDKVGQMMLTFLYEVRHYINQSGDLSGGISFDCVLTAF